MAEVRKLEGQVEIKCDADKFFEFWVHKTDDLCKVSPGTLRNIELLDGAWNVVGSKHSWTYDLSPNGERVSATAITEEIDEKRRSESYKVLDGDMMRNYYKSFKSRIDVMPKEGGGSVVKWTFDYEKLNEDAPEPTLNKDLMLKCAKDIDAYLCPAC